VALITASYSAFYGQILPVLEQVSDERRGEGAYLQLGDSRLWFGVEAIQILKG